MMPCYQYGMHRSYSSVHSDWIHFLLGRPAKAGPMLGEPINLRRIAERVGHPDSVVSRWYSGARTDLRLQQWGALLDLVMEEIGGVGWTHAQKRAIYWGGPKFYESFMAGRETLFERRRRTTRPRGKA